MTPKPPTLLGQTDKLGAGDSTLYLSAIEDEDDGLFETLKKEVRWQQLRHKSGVAPRLVGVQGSVTSCASTAVSASSSPPNHSTPGSAGLNEYVGIPIYRHPTDAPLPLSPFTPSVLRIKSKVEELVGHEVNHVLVQLYRDGRDFISEHSDKTLDVVRGSRIVNVSLGSERVMRLRSKKSAARHSVSRLGASGEGGTEALGEDGGVKERETQRVPLPHGSVFIMGPKTNRKYLHGIQPDKRPLRERSDAANAFGGERISLTFRLIGTFLRVCRGSGLLAGKKYVHQSEEQAKTYIYGQGARNKTLEKAGEVVNGDKDETERLVKMFSTENRSSEFDWEEVYEGGSDLLGFWVEKEEDEEVVEGGG